MSAARLPRAVHLGPFTYRVSDKLRDWKRAGESVETHWGYTLHAESLILIAPKMNAAMQRTVLLHEVLHAAAFCGGQLDAKKRPEEDWVSMAAPMLLDALASTPGLASFLAGADHE
jgi:hypothetical protein